MERNLILTTVLLFVYLSNSFSQCNIPAAPGLTCQSAIAFCNNELDGYCSATYNSAVGTVVDMPPFCGSVQNNIWIQFVAGSTTISLEFTVDNCVNGDGLQAMVLQTDDCTNFTGVTNCYTASVSGGGGGTNIFTLDASNYVIGETYYIMLDGWLGDFCDFSIDVVQGTTGVAPLANPVTPVGMTTVCPGASGITYSILPLANATSYNWSVPGGATYTLSPDELSITVDYSTFASSGNICVQAANDCDISDPTCLPINIQNLPPTNDYGEYCVGETFYYTVNNTNYTAGNYYITLPGASYLGCDSIVMLSVTENPIKETFLQEVICEGNFVEIGGVPFNQTNPNISVTLTSSEGCDSTVYLDLTVLNPQANIQQPEIISCNNQDVFINAALSNADTYTWSTLNGNILSGQGTPLVTVDAGGTYTLEVSMSMLGLTCSDSESVLVNENYEAPTISVSTSDLSCYEADDGSASVSPSGGIPPYSYAWSGGGNTPTVNGLSPGAYIVTVTGANGCDAEKSFIINEPLPLTYNIVLGNVSCHGGANGTGSINASGGLAPYSYQWSSGSNLNIEAGLSPGNYEVTVTDANACTVVEVFELLNPDPIEISFIETQPLCNGELGSATVVATGGSGNLNYLWSGIPIQTTASVSGLSVGLHTVTVTDQNGCYEIGSINIDAPVSMQAGISGVSPTCFSSLDGTATVNVSGGSGFFSYEWNTNPVLTTNSISNLESGTYEVTVTDQNTCSEILSINLNSPTEIQASFTTQNILCNGSSTGSVEAAISGGVAPYTFLWDDFNNQTTAVATNLSAGIYTVTITDASNCSIETTTTINEPLASIQIIGTSTPATCGSENGSIDLTITGGTAPYVFDWTSGIPAVEDPTSLGAGTYSVIVTDANGCSSTSSVSINTPTGLEAMINITEVTCFGDTDGAIDVSVIGGVEPYVFEWNNAINNGNEDFINIAAGDYSVTVTDDDGCSVIAAGIVSQPEILTGLATPGNATCIGTDGSINVIINGGTTPYDFDWNFAAYDGLQNLTDLIPGYYSVLVTDANGCSINLATDVIIPDGPSIDILVVDANCGGENSGSIDLNVIGGSAPYNFIWDNGLSNTEDQINLPAGSYNVTVSDQNNCSAITNALVGEPAALELTMDFNALSCFGGNNGGASVMVNGGVAPYTYSWNNGETSNIASGLAGGLATVNVTDANGCSANGSISVTQPEMIEVFYNVSNPSCPNENDGEIDLIITGGTGSYNFNWSNGSFSEDLNNLLEGLYEVTVTDGLGCTSIIQDISLNDPELLVVTSTSTMASCNTANGSIDLNVSGGSGVYIFEWSNGADAVEDPTGLVSGTYQVTVTDTNGCSAFSYVEVASPSGLSASAIAQDAQCFGGADGGIDLTVTGGLAPFTYTWDNSTQTTEDINDIPAGAYTVTILDANNCSTTAFANVQQPIEIESVIVATEATCGESNGAIFLTVTGGTAPYFYNWNNGSAVEDPTALAAGNYDVIITDINGCTAANNVSVLTPNQLSVIPTNLDARCKNSNTGHISLDVSGGEEPYTFNWSNGETSQDIEYLFAGIYTVTITDDQGCDFFFETEIFEPEAINSSFVSTYEACGNSNGTIDMTISGGTPPYSFNWQDGLGAMEDPIGLSAGVYFVTVTDANDCSFITSGEVTASPPYFINGILTEASCNGANDASINLNIEGGIPPYSFAWNTGQTTEDLTQISAGVYEVTATDSEGCSITHNLEIIDPPLLEVFLIEPINVSCSGMNDGGIVIEVVGGNPDYTFDWNEDILDGQQNPSDLAAGVYELTVTDLNGCNAILNVTIEQPSSLEIDASLTEVSCFENQNGSIDVSTTGGTMPYIFDWNNGDSADEDLIDIGAGEYELIVTDANACSQTVSFILENPDAIQVELEDISNYNGFNVSCNGESDAYVSLSANGGNAPYQFVWEDGTIAAEQVDLSQGVYSIIITDVNGCTIESQVELTAPMAINSELELEDPSCYNENDGQILINNTSGGMAPYVYSLNGDYFSNSDLFNGLIGGVYDLYVQDANGCEWSQEIELTNPNEIQVDLGNELLIQLGDRFQLDPVINIPLLEVDTFMWNSNLLNEFNPWLEPTQSTVYSLTIISEDGCIGKDEVNVIVKKDRLVYLPNIFTPNNDGVNDLFLPEFGKGVQKVNTFQVFDRWGEMVFEKANFGPDDNSNGWDGQLKGQALNPGVFIYFIEVEFTDGRIEVYSGDVTLMK